MTGVAGAASGVSSPLEPRRRGEICPSRPAPATAPVVDEPRAVSDRPQTPGIEDWELRLRSEPIGTYFPPATPDHGGIRCTLRGPNDEGFDVPM